MTQFSRKHKFLGRFPTRALRYLGGSSSIILYQRRLEMTNPLVSFLGFRMTAKVASDRLQPIYSSLTGHTVSVLAEDFP